MNWAVFRTTLHQRRWSIFWYSVGLVFYSYVMVWFWPQFQGTEYVDIIERMPPELIALMGSSGPTSEASAATSRQSTWGSCGC